MTRCLLRNSDTEWLLFREPRAVLTARCIADVVPMLKAAETFVTEQEGYAAGYIAYEAAPAFDRALQTHAPGGLPLLMLGLFDAPQRLSEPPLTASANAQAANWRMTTGREQYIAHLANIREQIALGNTYQVNYTTRLTADRALDAAALFADIAADAPYAALLEFSGHSIVSASPELFFRLDGAGLRCEPMKGTAERGLTTETDKAQASTLQASTKNRAENVMITDMIRNDLGRVARPGSVTAASLYDLRKFPTVWQMTSSVTALSDNTISDIFAALFPSASITGAPKASSMQLIKRLEDTPRNVYTGAIGWIGPNRTAQFSVAIRTALIEHATKTATYGVGGGIVWDSKPDDEYRECLAKSRVLATTSDDRNFQLLETLRWTPDSGFHLLDYHLDRLVASADYFDFCCDRQSILAQLNAAMATATAAALRVRLTVTRAGIATITMQNLSLPGKHTVLHIAKKPIDTGSPFVYHKTTQRRLYNEALDDVGPADDVLLWNESGEITESSIANVVVRFGNKWVTPPVHCGLLAGTERRHSLSVGKITEEVVTLEQLRAADEIGLINSVRGWYPAELAAE